MGKRKEENRESITQFFIIYVLYNNIREKKNLYIKKHRGTSHKAASSPDLCGGIVLETSYYLHYYRNL